MFSFVRRLRGLALAVLGTYIVAGFFMEAFHHDLTEDLLPAPVLAAHTCGDVEHHVPLDQWHECAACFYANIRISTPAAGGWNAAEVPFVSFAPLPPAMERIVSSSRLLPSKRGPPVA